MAKKPESRPNVKKSRLSTARFQRALALARVLDLNGSAGRMEHDIAVLDGEIRKARELLDSLEKERAHTRECLEGFASGMPAALSAFTKADAVARAAGAPHCRKDELCTGQWEGLAWELQYARDLRKLALEKGGTR